MPSRRPESVLHGLLAAETLADLPRLQEALGGASPITVGRALRRISYRRSYNHNGRYYSLHDPARYDANGLWSVRDVHFSMDGSLKATVRRMVSESDAGRTHQELSDLLRVRVHNTLLDLVREGELTRWDVDGLFHYVHADPEVAQEQLRRRQEVLKVDVVQTSIGDEVVIRVLLVLLRHPGATPGDIVRHLAGRSPPITRDQIDIVFSRYGLGEKGGPKIY